MKTIAFFSNEDDFGKESLVYHIAYRFGELKNRVVVADLDPLSSLTAMFMNNDELRDLWWENGNTENGNTIYTAISPIIEGTGDFDFPIHQEPVNNVFLILGDPRLSKFEDELSRQWELCLKPDEGAFRLETAFSRIIKRTADECKAEWAIINIGPKLDGISRAALIACDYIITPLSQDLFSWQSLKTMKSFLETWREEWKERKKKFKDLPDTGIDLPDGDMALLGYIAMLFNVYPAKPVKSHQKHLHKMPTALEELIDNPYKLRKLGTLELGTLRDHYLLIPITQEACKPMSHLTSADGVFDANMAGIRQYHINFKNLVETIIRHATHGTYAINASDIEIK